jgi:hypothetical protein
MSAKSEQALSFANKLPEATDGKEEFVNLIASLVEVQEEEFDDELEYKIFDHPPEVKAIYAEWLKAKQ